MQRMDASLLAQNLNAIAEVYEKKPVSSKALEVWFDTLKEFPTEQVMGKIINWPKSHIRFPAPAELWKELNDKQIERREEAFVAEKALAVREQHTMYRTEQGSKIIKEMKRMMQDTRRLSARELAHLMLQKQAQGEQLLSCQVEFIRDNLDTEEHNEEEAA